ncbi:hypothetical protein [Actinomadura sp. 6N118]|uniref:hypothetical protein n=1 Tax=Actinomadura sp. 6N118 TaxID=3375151 RepID=UPI00378F5706
MVAGGRGASPTGPGHASIITRSCATDSAAARRAVLGMPCSARSLRYALMTANAAVVGGGGCPPRRWMPRITDIIRDSEAGARLRSASSDMNSASVSGVHGNGVRPADRHQPVNTPQSAA